MAPDSKLPLPKFLAALTGNGVPVSKAMEVARKMYREYNTPSKLSELTDTRLIAVGVADKEDRRLVLAAIHKAGYQYKGKDLTREEAIKKKSMVPSTGAGPSAGSSAVQAPSSGKRKRKRPSDWNEFLPEGSTDDDRDSGDFEFNETSDESTLLTKSVVINRAPIMTAWAMIVSERLGFKREEALSIASVYTEMNALTKGVSLGIFDKGKGKGIEASPTGSQPYVDIMGRSPLYQTQEGQWRALSKGSPVFPGAAFSYLNRSFRQTTPHVIGALRLLALSYPPNVLNNTGWALYADFRPQVDGWGKRSEVKFDTILNLRRKNEGTMPVGVSPESTRPIVKVEGPDATDRSPAETNEPQIKKARTMTLDEYEAALEHDTTFDNVNLDFPASPGKD